MAKRRSIDVKEFKTLWKALPQNDKDFINALIFISTTLGDEKLCCHELPKRIERVLHGVDRETLFSVVAECVGLLLSAPAMERVKRARSRNAKPQRTPPKKNATVRTRPKAKRGRSK